MEAPLHLHFDVNKTIIFSDEASGQSVADVVASILAENRGGHGEGEVWVLGEGGQGPLSYGAWTRARLGDGPAAKALRQAFVDPGAPGAALAPEAARLAAEVRRQQTRHYFAASFVRLAEWLAAQPRPWSVFFRTFGSDLPDVVRHWNALVARLGVAQQHAIQADRMGKFTRPDQGDDVPPPHQVTLAGCATVAIALHVPDF